MTSPDHEAEQRRRVAERTFVGFWVVLAVGVSFAVVLGLVAARWAPLRSADVAVAQAANDAVSGVPWLVSALRFVTNLGGSEAAWLLLSVATVWLLIRRLPRLAAYVAVTGLGAAMLSTGIKAIVARARPVVDVVIATAPGESFPSGHALGSTVTYGVLLLVFLPVVPVRARRPVVVATVTLVTAVGLTRVALGVHFLSDVIGGWLLGVLWLGVTAAAFAPWRAQEGRVGVRAGRPADDRSALEPAPAHDPPLPAGWHSVTVLVVSSVALWGALVGMGVLLTDHLPAVQQVDSAIVLWFARMRSDLWTELAVLVGHLGGTAGIVVLVVVAVPLLLAATGRWRPALFVLIAVGGETALFLATAAVVSRTRPAVEHLSATLPPTSSYPSGHVAATVAAYGALAVLAWAWTSGWPRYAACTLAGAATVGVALSRVYRGVHHPTDVLASILYAAAWVAVCWWVLRPGPSQPAEDGQPQPDASRDRVPQPGRQR